MIYHFWYSRQTLSSASHATHGMHSDNAGVTLLALPSFILEGTVAFLPSADVFAFIVVSLRGRSPKIDSFARCPLVNKIWHSQFIGNKQTALILIQMI
jgi:hypothetical protein